MAVTRMSLGDVMAQPPQVDRAKMDATTEADLRRHALEDGEAPDAPLRPEEWLLAPASIRKRLGMTQQQFAGVLRLPIATLRNWEQHRVEPDPAARALLRILAREPEAALRALAE